MSIHVSALNVYPIKSCAGTPLQEVELDQRGIRHDREFMVVNSRGRFVTQREHPPLALIKPVRTESTLVLTAPGMPPLTIEPHDSRRYDVTIWRDRVLVADQGEVAADWLSTYLSDVCRLVRLPDDVHRLVDPEYATGPRDEVGLADGFPVLLTSEESLADLSKRLGQALPMNRFRPNVVVRGAGVPYAEDQWAAIRIGDLPFSVVKACARCVITTTDQLTGARGREPLATLARYRRVARGVLFGQNLIHPRPGRLVVGAPVSVLREASSPAIPKTLNRYLRSGKDRD